MLFLSNTPLQAWKGSLSTSLRYGWATFGVKTQNQSKQINYKTNQQVNNPIKRGHGFGLAARTITAKVWVGWSRRAGGILGLLREWAQRRQASGPCGEEDLTCTRVGLEEGVSEPGHLSSLESGGWSITPHCGWFWAWVIDNEMCPQPGL